jgi:hypothetical protein
MVYHEDDGLFWWDGTAAPASSYPAAWPPAEPMPPAPLPAGLLAAERCYGQHVTAPGFAPHDGGRPVYWWLDLNGDWAGLCGPCCTRWRYHQQLIGGGGPKRITSRRPPGHVKLLGLGDDGEPTCAHCAAARRAVQAGNRMLAGRPFPFAPGYYEYDDGPYGIPQALPSIHYPETS